LRGLDSLSRELAARKAGFRIEPIAENDDPANQAGLRQAQSGGFRPARQAAAAPLQIGGGLCLYSLKRRLPCV
jgi:hypothetical protein